jgi:hypothetical protein
MRRRSGRSHAQARAARPTGANAGRRPTAISSTSTGSRPPRSRRAAGGALPRPRGQFASHYAGALMRRWPARLERRGAAFPRLLGRAEPAAARLPLGRLRRDRLDPAPPARPVPAADALFAAGISLGGNALLKWAGEQGAAATWCRPSPASARRSTSPPPRALQRLRSLVYAKHFLRHPEAPMRGAKLARFPASSTKRACARRATSTNSTTPSPRRCTASATPTTTGAAPAASPGSAAYACRRWCSTRTTTPSCRGGAARRAASLGLVTLDYPAQGGGHVGFVSGPFPGHLDWLPQRLLAYFDARR